MNEEDKENLKLFFEKVQTFPELVAFIYYAFKDITERLEKLEVKE
jgi:hypothetical protein